MKISNADLRAIIEHIKVTNSEIGTVQRDVVILKNDITWIKKIQWFLVTTSISSLIGVIIILFKTAIGG